jgi:hypothetical protein
VPTLANRALAKIENSAPNPTPKQIELKKQLSTLRDKGIAQISGLSKSTKSTDPTFGLVYSNRAIFQFSILWSPILPFPRR